MTISKIFCYSLCLSLELFKYIVKIFYGFTLNRKSDVKDKMHKLFSKWYFTRLIRASLSHTRFIFLINKFKKCKILQMLNNFCQDCYKYLVLMYANSIYYLYTECQLFIWAVCSHLFPAADVNAVIY